ncbi:hypothetical protein HPB50_008123 [Hyalomma asiaticum]|uniref:Uncharacterized protein n=1 Tax=Hyalomma asiaticum TaxID=266040 RepID=A0ACB7TEL1_HYAAI|nr:hypothetical protein HPB50_008123 [Hyalomma asiaticum]
MLLAAVAVAEDNCPVNACGERSWTNGRPQPQVSARLYGPGLQGDFNLPARYFFVHVVDASGNNFCSLFPKVYRKCYGQHVGFSMFMDQLLLSLARKCWTLCHDHGARCRVSLKPPESADVLLLRSFDHGERCIDVPLRLLYHEIDALRTRWNPQERTRRPWDLSSDHQGSYPQAL